jgi:hypothetical protein
MRSARMSFLTRIQPIGSKVKEQKHWREVWSATRPSLLSISTVYSANIDELRSFVILMCVQGIGSETKEQKHWREVWSATPPSPLSISGVHSADMDAFRVRVSFLTCIQ